MPTLAIRLGRADERSRGPGAPPVWLYGAVVGVAAWLVFWVQPLAVRGVLPVLGGSPAVWNTAMVFFQSALLGGYGLAHLLVRRTVHRTRGTVGGNRPHHAGG